MASTPKLFDQVRLVLRVRHYSYETEKSYIHWIKRFIAFHQMRPPREMGAAEVEAFLTHLAVEQKVAPSPIPMTEATPSPCRRAESWAQPPQTCRGW
ncbi:MAG: hypothetical protein DCF32_03450 [Leptolyngbya sp.]|nr:MAG: hypothetical protein DCF32_03450 [Leptolyngbya sp.]